MPQTLKVSVGAEEGHLGHNPVELLVWPPACACCLSASPETHLTISREPRDLASGVTLYSISAAVPYCLRCRKHLPSKSALVTLARPMGVLLILIGLALLRSSSNSSILAIPLALGGVFLWVAAPKLREWHEEKRTESLNSRCADKLEAVSIEAEVEDRHLPSTSRNFTRLDLFFRNEKYAYLFVQTNQAYQDKRTLSPVRLRFEIGPLSPPPVAPEGLRPDRRGTTRTEAAPLITKPSSANSVQFKPPLGSHYTRYDELALRALFFAVWEAGQRGAPCNENGHQIIELSDFVVGISLVDLGHLGVTVELGKSIRSAIRNAVPRRESTSGRSTELSLEVKRAQTYAGEEAERLGHTKKIEIGHLLLGVLRLEQTSETAVLRQNGLDLTSLRAAVRQHPRPEVSVRPATAETPKTKDEGESAALKLCQAAQRHPRPDYEGIARIGRQLYAHGGDQFMRAVLQRVRELAGNRAEVDCFTIELGWGGIGNDRSPWISEVKGKPAGSSGLPPTIPPEPSSAPVENQGADFKCPFCSRTCLVEPAPFSRHVNLYRCPEQHFVGVRCGSCSQGLMAHVGDLEVTVTTKCPNCGWLSSGIPKAWWYETPGLNSTSTDRRRAFGECLENIEEWGGLRFDLLGVRFINAEGARSAFSAISAKARESVARRGVVVVRGRFLWEGAAVDVAGIICTDRDTETNVRWLADVSVLGRQKGKNFQLGDQNGEQFGRSSSPLTVYDFVVVQPPSQ